MATPAGPARVSASIRAASSCGSPALIPYITAGFPDRESLPRLLRSLAPHAAAIEIGVPFSDPMADGATLQRTARIALEHGVTLCWILDELQSLDSTKLPPLVLMGYLNPFLNLGVETLAARCAKANVAALIIPDLPIEEADEIQSALRSRGVGLIHIVSPVTPMDRAARIAAASDGFLYAVTMTGVTGETGMSAADPALTTYLDSLRGVSPVPVCAGFGIRSRDQVRALAGHADGVIIGSALAEPIERGEDPGAILRALGYA